MAFLTELFTGTNGDDLTTLGWTKNTAAHTGGTIEVQSNRAQAKSDSGGGTLYHKGTPTSANYSVTFDYRASAINQADYAYVGARTLDSAKTGYFVGVNNDTSPPTLHLIKIVAGTTTELDSASYGITGATVYSITLTVNGTSISATAATDTTPLNLSATDATISAAGTVGLHLFYGGGGTSAIDNVVASDLAPSLSSVVVNTVGNTVSMLFSESVTVGAGGNGGFTIDATGGAATMTYASGSGSTTLVYSLSRTLDTNETGNIDYTQPGNGIEATTGGADVASFLNEGFTNNTINAPTIGTAAAAGTDAIDLTWTDNASNETQFRYQRDTNSGFSAPTSVVVNTANTEATTDATLAAATTYYYRVRAENGNGVSLWSGTVSATTDAVSSGLAGSRFPGCLKYGDSDCRRFAEAE